MKNVLSFIKLHSITIINWLVVFAGIFLLVKTSSSPFYLDLQNYELFFNALKPFSIFNAEISSLSASVLAAYIFYIVNNYIPERRRTKEYNIQISPHIEKIIDNISKIFRILNEHSNLYIKFPVSSYEEIENIAKNIKFKEQYMGSLIHHPTIPNTAIYETIEYHMFHHAKDCLDRINELRTKNIIIDYALAQKLDTLEQHIKFVLTKYRLLMESTNSDTNFLGLVKLHSILFKAAQDIMNHYNKKIKINKGYSYADIWFNPDARNYADKQKSI